MRKISSVVCLVVLMLTFVAQSKPASAALVENRNVGCTPFVGSTYTVKATATVEVTTVYTSLYNYTKKITAVKNKSMFFTGFHIGVDLINWNITETISPKADSVQIFAQGWLRTQIFGYPISTYEIHCSIGVFA
jgi:hypothetical protein